MRDAHELAGVLPMIGFFRKLWRDKRGNALVIAAAAMPLVSARPVSPATRSSGRCGSGSSSAPRIPRRSPAFTIAWSRTRDALPTAVDRDLTLQPATLAYATDDGDRSAVRRRTTGRTTNAVRVALAVQQPLSFSGMFMCSARRSPRPGPRPSSRRATIACISLETARHRHHRDRQRRRRHRLRDDHQLDRR